MDRGSHRGLYFLAKTREFCLFQGQHYVMNDHVNRYISRASSKVSTHRECIKPMQQTAVIVSVCAIMSTVATDHHRIVTTS